MKINLNKLKINITFKKIDVCNATATQSSQDIQVNKGRFASAFATTNTQVVSFNMSGYTIYPGFINAHDHLLGNYLPKVGKGPYLNWKPWDADLKSSAVYQERAKLSISDIYLLGVYRQILSGVTTVSDHIPHVVNRAFTKDAYVRIIRDYALSHEGSSYDLGWGEGIKKEVSKSKRKNIPYICHVEEGYDEEAKRGIPILAEHNALYENTILIHCISCNIEDIKLMAKKKVNMVWCPVSNIYMFNDTANIKAFLKHGVNVTIGTDSPMSGGINLFNEIQEAKKIYQKMFDEEISNKKLFKMVTINGAKAFGLHHKIGSIALNKEADFFILKNEQNNSDPYDRVLNANTLDLEMVVKGGVPLFLKEKYKSLIVEIEHHYDLVNIQGENFFLIGLPNALKKRIDDKVGYKKFFSFFPI